jgi:hypothetical protein
MKQTSADMWDRPERGAVGRITFDQQQLDVSWEPTLGGPVELNYYGPNAHAIMRLDSGQARFIAACLISAADEADRNTP